MASILAMLKTVVSSLAVALIVSIPIVWILWKIRTKKIKRLIPGDMDNQILKHKESEKEVQNAREEREEEKDRIKDLPAVRETGGAERNIIKSVINNQPREKSGGDRELPKAKASIDTKSKRQPVESEQHDEQNWPNFS